MFTIVAPGIEERDGAVSEEYDIVVFDFGAASSMNLNELLVGLDSGLLAVICMLEPSAKEVIVRDISRVS